MTHEIRLGGVAVGLGSRENPPMSLHAAPSIDALEVSVEALRTELRALGSVAVAFSGGADSAFLAWMAQDTLGFDNVLAVTAVSPSLAIDEYDDCRALAQEWGIELVEVATDEMTRAAYQLNDGDRCFHCKDALMDAIGPVAAEAGATVVLGVNVDDLGDHRPGQSAASQRGARFPLVDAGFTKDQLRAASRHFGLRTWDKPAAACLASRIPYGTTVTLDVLDAVGRAEARLRRLGFRELRVRHYDKTARIEVPVDRLHDVVDARAAIVDAVRGCGYDYVTLDLDGLKSGNLNRALGLHAGESNPPPSP